ncbi:GDSL esterase/lipase At3g27950-like isoform X2 [Actinidia eriantha]|uniref:GDSL esterase/lipase At3g27950-like isoform X2 n=1 Tax=Actinidia eriantha TaxID=165200 RepID=UPI0025869CB3|nr:GDSL esterase/lipase At3g27950-like isoform X2 [Actinidia eriantha]
MKMTSMDDSIVRRWKAPRKRIEAVAIAVILIAAFLIFRAMRQGIRNPSLGQPGGCHFPAVFNFGDSNSDTGSMSAVFAQLLPPNGRTFFGKPSGRFSDGRLIIDFIAEKLGLPYLSAYLDSIGTSFRNGANFAASGSSIKSLPGLNHFHLRTQLNEFEQFKARAIELHNKDKSSYAKTSLPTPEAFPKALYTLDTGQNDLVAGLTSSTVEQVKRSIPSIIDEFALALKKLYQHGARAFWVHNTSPIGCLPSLILKHPPNPSNADQAGCIKSYNDVAQDFNEQLKDRVSLLRAKLQDALLVYVDIYSPKFSLISEAKHHGFVDPLGYCCGGQRGHKLECGGIAIVNTTQLYGASCFNPSQYISWDSIHYTEAANKWVADRILDGSLSDPPIPITQACHNVKL